MLEQIVTQKPTPTKQDLLHHLENLKSNISTRKLQLSAAVEYFNELIRLLSLDTELAESPEMLALVKSACSRFGKLAFKG